MAPLIRLLALFALSTAVLASPHVSRNVYNHAHRAVVVPDVHINARASLPLPRRQRSLNKRCVPRPTANSTTSAVPTSTVVPTSAAPINVAPVPSLPTSSPSSAAETTSSYVPPSQAPPPTTSASPTPTTEAPSPTPTTTPPPPPPTTSSTTSSTLAPAQTSSSSSSTTGLPSNLIGNLQGQGTWYATGLGACGWTNNDSQNIVAISQLIFDTFPGYDGVNPNTNPVCGRQITATYQGKSVTATVSDRCTGCQELDLDFSPNAFDTLAAASVGRIDMNWVFI